MGFEGLVVTDSLDMGGVARHYALGEASVQAILAGADLLLQAGAPDAALAALRDAAKSGRLPIERIDQSVARVLRAKARVGLHRNRFIDLEALPRLLARAEFERAADEIASRGVTALRDMQRILPLDAARPAEAVALEYRGRSRSLSRDGHWKLNFAGTWIRSKTLRFDTRFAPIGNFDVASLRSYDAVILALFVRVADRKGSVALPEEQAAAVHRVLAAETPAIVACFGSPYVIKHFPEAKTWVGVFSSADVAQKAAARAIFGQTPIGGRIPVSVPGAVRIGEGIDVAANPMKLEAANAEMRAQNRTRR